MVTKPANQGSKMLASAVSFCYFAAKNVQLPRICAFSGEVQFHFRRLPIRFYKLLFKSGKILILLLISGTMICKRVKPAADIRSLIKEYMILHTMFDSGSFIPAKAYPVNPEEGITFVLRGSLRAETPELGLWQDRPTTTLFGMPER